MSYILGAALILLGTAAILGLVCAFVHSTIVGAICCGVMGFLMLVLAGVWDDMRDDHPTSSTGPR